MQELLVNELFCLLRLKKLSNSNKSLKNLSNSDEKLGYSGEKLENFSNSEKSFGKAQSLS